jgi:hypothetical protein
VNIYSGEWASQWLNGLAAAQVDVENRGNDVDVGPTRQDGAVSLSLCVSTEGK